MSWALPLGSDACTFHEHDRGKLFLFQKYAQYTLIRRYKQPPWAEKLSCPKYLAIKWDFY